MPIHPYAARLHGAGLARCVAVALVLSLATIAALLPRHARGQAQPPMPGEYQIVGGKVDRGTYSGWRIFHTACYGCHGVDAKGTDVAPNLMERIRTMTERQFATKVLTSYRIALAPGTAADEDPATVRDALIEEAMRRDRQKRGQIVMPAWERSPAVNPHVLDLYAYLSARADGKLGPGRPRVIGDKR